MWRRVLTLIKKEFIAIWQDPKSRMIIIVPPLLQLLLFANALTMEVKNIDMIVLDRSQSVESRELISRFANSKWFKTITYANNEQDIKHYVETQRVQLALEIGNDFSAKVKRSEPTSVQLIVDGRQTNSAGITGAYASQIVSAYSNELSPRNNGAQINTIVRNWFNPNLEYQWYLLASLVTTLALVIALMLTALSIARERELGTFDQLIVSPLTSFEILIGKTIPPLVIAVLLTIFMIVMSIIFFKLPFVGSIIWYLIATVFALLAIVGVGLFVSSLCKTQQQAILGAFTFQMPAILLSGFMAPITDMPVFLQYLTYINPVRFFMTITKGIFFKGMPPLDIIQEIIPLILIATVTLSLAGWTFKRKLD